MSDTRGKFLFVVAYHDERFIGAEAEGVDDIFNHLSIVCVKTV